MTERSTIAYQPALDGVRALAVAAVLLFHAEVAGFRRWLPRGVGVLHAVGIPHHEPARARTRPHRRHRPPHVLRAARQAPAPGEPAVPRGHRVRVGGERLFDGVADLRRQIARRDLQVANWVFLAGDGSYQQIFQQTGGTRSPLEHYWSLAIEEQFYWVWPPGCSSSAVCARGAAARSRSRPSPRCSRSPPR